MFIPDSKPQQLKEKFLKEQNKVIEEIIVRNIPTRTHEMEDFQI